MTVVGENCQPIFCRQYDIKRPNQNLKQNVRLIFNDNIFLWKKDKNNRKTLLIWFRRCLELSKHFVVNLHLTWAERSASGPEITVTVGTGVRVTAEVRIIVVTRAVCNVDIMPSTKGWTIIVVSVCGILWIDVYVVLEVAISIIVSQGIYEGVCRVQVCSRTP